MKNFKLILFFVTTTIIVITETAYSGDKLTSAYRILSKIHRNKFFTEFENGFSSVVFLTLLKRLTQLATKIYVIINCESLFQKYAKPDAKSSKKFIAMITIYEFFATLPFDFFINRLEMLNIFWLPNLIVNFVIAILMRCLFSILRILFILIFKFIAIYFLRNFPKFLFAFGMIFEFVKFVSNQNLQYEICVPTKFMNCSEIKNKIADASNMTNTDNIGLSIKNFKDYFILTSVSSFVQYSIPLDCAESFNENQLCAYSSQKILVTEFEYGFLGFLTRTVILLSYFITVNGLISSSTSEVNYDSDFIKDVYVLDTLIKMKGLIFSELESLNARRADRILIEKNYGVDLFDSLVKCLNPSSFDKIKELNKIDLKRVCYLYNKVIKKNK